jgi:histidinol-phosphate aminotransferase
MRVGIVIGQPPALQPVRDVTLPFNINVIALHAVQARSTTRNFCRATAAQVQKSRDMLYARVPPSRAEYWESAANYVLVQVGETAPFMQALSARRIHVRDRSKDPSTPGCVRITAGVVEHTQARFEALESVVAARQAR